MPLRAFHPQAMEHILTDTPRTLTSQAEQVLRQDILSGLLEPGARLKIKELQNRYGLGLSPLRESLQRLSAEGLVVIDEQRGFAVASVSMEELKDLTRARTALESIMLPMAIEQGGEDWEAEIVAAFHLLSRTPFPLGKDADANKWEARHRAFHESLVAGCRSPWLMRIHRQMVDQSERYRKIRIQHLSEQQPLIRDVNAEHQAVMEAVLHRESQRAVALMTEHLNATFIATARWLSTDQAEESP